MTRPLRDKRGSSRVELRFLQFVLRWSHSRRVDGVWLGCFDKETSQRALDRAESALQLIARYDKLSYSRVSWDLERIWVNFLPGI